MLGLHNYMFGCAMQANLLGWDRSDGWMGRRAARALSGMTTPDVRGSVARGVVTGPT